MKLLVGLGNIGAEYENTRHNVGFILLDKFASRLGTSFSENKKISGLLASTELYKLLKPTTYMNNSGDAVAKTLAYFKLSVADLIVIHDDLDLEFGRIKKDIGSSSAGHHGVDDIITKLGTKEFARIRFGIGRPSDRSSSADYVLKDFTSTELSHVNSLDVSSIIVG